MKIKKYIFAIILLLFTLGFNNRKFFISENKITNSKQCQTQYDSYSKELFLNKIEMYQEFKKINNIKLNNRKEWFIAYKNVIERYAYYFDKPETIYDYYNNEDLFLLFSVVEAETTGSSFDEKVNVASVIFNRIDSGNYPDELSLVLSKDQFSCVSDNRYKSVDITIDTILACEYAFEIEDTTNGALYFDSTKNESWASKNLTYIFTDSIGHSFYK